jgi:hypothetical protein
VSDARPHRIRRVVFELRFPSEATAFSVRHELEWALHNELMPALEEALDACAPEGATFRIDRLEVDLGRLPAERFDRNRIAELVLERLADRIAGLPAADVDVRSPSESLADTLSAFLRTGRLPWASTIQSVAELEPAVLSLPREEGKRLVARLRPVLVHSAPSRRLVYQFDPEFVTWVILRLHPAAAAVLRLEEERPRAPTTTGAQSRLIRILATRPPSADARSLVDEVSRLGAKSRSRSVDDTQGRREARDLQAPADQDGEAGTDSEATDETLSTAFAGIVLLHPFFERLFQRLGLVDGHSRFESTADRIRGVHLLYHLATGHEQPEEPHTPLLKLLCGLPLSGPIPRRLALEAADRLECETLIVEAIRLWDSLGDTTPQGMREGFIQREGLMEVVDSGWRVTVERRGVDVLLESLPWGIGVVRMPWMDAPLFVDWG